jgi:hypothetical protein
MDGLFQVRWAAYDGGVDYAEEWDGCGRDLFLYRSGEGTYYPLCQCSTNRRSNEVEAIHRNSQEMQNTDEGEKNAA